MNPLLRLALLLCPAEFRCEHRDRITADSEHARPFSAQLFGMCADIAVAGLAMRAENIARDLTFSVRSLIKAPLFAIVAGGAIALAIGANIAVSSVLFGVALKPLPFPDAGRLTFVAAGQSVFARLSMYDAASLRTTSRSFATLALAREASQTYAGPGTTPVALKGRLIDGAYFGVLGARAQIGRLLDDSDLSRARIVLSFQTWQHLFSGDPNILGKRVRFRTDTFTVVGVAKPGFQDPAPYGLAQSDFWVPIDMHSPIAFSRVWRACYGIGRLAPGVSAVQAQADASRIIAGLARRDPTSFVGISRATVLPFFSVIVGPAVPILWMLYAAVAVVLLIACANVANLNLVRAAKREGELRIRSAVGATRSRIVGQLVTEAALLAGIGGLAGLGIGAALLALFRRFAAEQLPRFENAVIDPSVVLYTVALMVFCTLFIGVIPALATRGSAPSARSGESRGTNRLRSVLVVAEIALALAVVVNAGLIVRSYVALTHVPLGFDGRNTYVVDFVLAPPYAPAKLRTFIQTSTKTLHTIAGVTAVSAAGPVPFVFDYFMQAFSLPGRSEKFMINKHIIGSEYFNVFGVPLLRGRMFADRDTAVSPSVVIVNARFAQRYFGTLDVVGRRLEFQSFTKEPAVASTIIGVTGDVRNAFYSPPEPEAYVFAMQDPSIWRYVIRTNGADAGLAESVTRVLRGIDPAIPTPVITPYSELFFRNSNQTRAATVLFGTLGLVSLLLAIAGVFAVTSYSVEQRTREFGIRKAIGAGRGDILHRVLRSALLQSCVGIGLGLVAATVSTRLLTSLLFETSPFDPLTLVCVVVLLVLSTIIAAGAPAVRATGVDPATALRYE